ncbi:hypothetical protein IH785_02410 [candidate division KSB1 bacterium]|nr:hypothetical protein [candidate division KSB1 bacterium]
MKLMLQKFLWCILIFFSILSSAGELIAQPAGAPIYTESNGEFTISLDGGFFTKKIFKIKNESRRFFLKGSYGLSSKLDIYGLFGLTNLSLTLADSARTLLDDGFKIAYGGGLSLQILNFESLQTSLFFNGQMIRFISKPASESTLGFGSQILQFNYDWRETNLTFGLTKKIGAANFYGGINTKIIRRFETKIDKLVFSGQNTTVTREKGKYTSGLLMSPLFGLDLNLPSRLKFSLELSANDESDFAVYFGLSQTGKP